MMTFGRPQQATDCRFRITWWQKILAPSEIIVKVYDEQFRFFLVADRERRIISHTLESANIGR